MKNFTIALSIFVLAGLLISSINYSSHSPGGRTNSPIDGSNCTACHSGSAIINQTGWITSNIPVTGYIPGQTYTITINATDQGAVHLGFEATAENASSKVGTFIITNSSETQLTGNNHAITHTSSGVTPQSGSKSWSFDWTAPVAQSGDVTFYAAFVAGNGSSSSGDQVYTSTLSVQEDVSASIQNIKNASNISVYPNPSQDFVNISQDYEQATIFSINGEVVGQYSHQQQISLLDLESGQYLLKIDQNKAIKLIKK